MIYIVITQIFTGKSQLEMAAAFTGFVQFLMFILWPVACPLSMLLDYLFGREEASPNVPRDELEALMTLQQPSSKDLTPLIPNSGHRPSNEEDKSLSASEVYVVCESFVFIHTYSIPRFMVV